MESFIRCKAYVINEETRIEDLTLTEIQRNKIFRHNRQINTNFKLYFLTQYTEIKLVDPELRENCISKECEQ